MSNDSSAGSTISELPVQTVVTDADLFVFDSIEQPLGQWTSQITAANLAAYFTTKVIVGSGFLARVNNLSDLLNAATARNNLGLGSAALLAAGAIAQTANNLSDLANAATARSNLGLGSIATQAASNVAITGGAINGTTIGQTTQAAGAFSTVSAGTAASTALLTVTSQTGTLPTPTSGTKAHIIGDATGCFEQLDAYASSATIIFERANGILGTLTALADTNVIGGFQFKGYNGTAYSGPTALIRGLAQGAWTGSNEGTALAFSTTPLNSTTFATAMTLYSGLVVGPGTTDPGVGNLSYYSGLASITSGGASAGGITDLAIYQEMFPSITLSSASRGLIDIPVGNTIISQNAIAGFVRNKSGGAGSAGNGVCLGGYGTAEAGSTALWGINTLLQDNSSRAVGALTGVILANEFDFNVMCPATTVLGVSVGGNSLSQPTIAQGFTVNTLGTGVKWQYAFTSQPGAANVGFGLGALAATGANVSSQPITMGWHDGAAASQTDIIQSASGFVSISSTSGAWNGVSIQSGSVFLNSGFNITINGKSTVATDGSSNTVLGNSTTATVLAGGRALTGKNVATPLTGATVTLSAIVPVQIINPAGTLAALTVTLPASPIDGQTQVVSFGQAITTLTVNGGTTVGAPTSIALSSPVFAMIYDSGTSKWYRLQ